MFHLSITRMDSPVLDSGMLPTYHSHGPCAIYDQAVQLTYRKALSECPLCLDDFSCSDDPQILPCHHSFHRPCIQMWLERGHSTCPICQQRAVLTEKSCVQRSMFRTFYTYVCKKVKLRAS